jgi:sugar/nucleoside kinase (ribokinase family)
VTPPTRTRVWVVGAIAWDTVVHLDTYPKPGGFTRGRRKIERPGGSAGNVAQALATAGVETGFVTSLGRDERGAALQRTLEESSLEHVHIGWVDGESEHVLVIVHDQGDRTILGLTADHPEAIRLHDVPLVAGDIVVFVVWDERYREDLRIATEAGCVTVVGLAALEDAAVRHADIAFGSRVDIHPDTDPRAALDRFDRIVMTSGAQGARQYTGDGVLTRPAEPAQVVDTTGAGDAFLAGYLAAYAHGFTDGSLALRAGARWAAAMVSVEASIPPAWPSVAGAAELLPPPVLA